MVFKRILWDELIPNFLRKKGVDIIDGQQLIMMALQDIDSRISDLEQQHEEIQKGYATHPKPEGGRAGITATEGDGE